MATPIDDASNRCASRVEFSATTAKTTSPGCRYFTPSLRASNLQFGGKIEDTRTRFWAAIPASRNANSNDVSRSRCFPTPFVKKIRFGTMSLPNSVILQKIKLSVENAQSNTMFCKGNMNLRARGKKMRERVWVASRWQGERQPAGSGSRGDACHGDGGVLLGSCDRHACPGLFVERGQCRFVAGFERVDLVGHHKRVLRSLANAGSGAAGVIARHGVLGAAHGVADGAGKGLCLGRECGRSGQSRHHDQVQQKKSNFPSSSIHYRFSLWAGPRANGRRNLSEIGCRTTDEVTNRECSGQKMRGALARVPA